MQKPLTIFLEVFCVQWDCKHSISLTNNVASFEQPRPELYSMDMNFY